MGSSPRARSRLNWTMSSFGYSSMLSEPIHILRIIVTTGLRNISNFASRFPRIHSVLFVSRGVLGDTSC